MSAWKRLFSKARREAELDTELRDHLERQMADYIRSGIGEAEARRRAHLDLGGLEQVKEACRDARGTRLLDDLGQDLRYGFRTLRRSPAFTLVAVLSLALGIGANTAVFTIVDSLLLRSLPVHDPRGLVRLEGDAWANPVWEEIRARHDHFLHSVAAFSEARFDLASGGEAEHVEGLYASGSFFEVLGVPAILGRTFTLDDDQRGGGDGGPVAVISYGFWQRRFGGAAGAVGRSLVLNGVPVTIVGVTPQSFFGPTVGRSFDVAVPIGMVDRLQWGPMGSLLESPSMWWLEILGRLKQGQTDEAATRALRAVQPQIREATLPDGLRGRDLEEYLREGLTLVTAASGFSPIRGQYTGPLLSAMAVVVLVLLVACANLASLLLARTNARRHELGARLALGASRPRLLRQLLAESLLLAVPGGLLGLVLAQWGARLLVGQLSNDRGVSAVFLDLSPHGGILAFTVGVTLATVFLLATAPALHALRLGPQDALRGRRSVHGGGAGGMGGPLVVSQVALSLVLVFGAGLFGRTFASLAYRHLGLEAEAVLLVSLDLQRSVPPRQRAALVGRVVEGVQAIPGVARASASSLAPLGGAVWSLRFEVQGSPQPDDREAWMNAVTPGWFQTYGTPLLAGRDFRAADRAGTPPVAIVNQAFARRYLSGSNPVGRLLLRHGAEETRSPLEIVGLVGDAVYRSPRDPMEPTVYLPLAQLDQPFPLFTLSVLAEHGPPALLAGKVKDSISTVDPRLSLRFRLLSDQVAAAVGRERAVAALSGFFAALAILIGAVGLYGVTSYAVGRRQREIGLRMALGAQTPAILRLVLEGSLRLVALGLAIGLSLSWWASRFVTSLLYGLEPGDVPTLAGSAFVLAGVSLFAAGLPALRAARIDPAEQLREG